MSKCQALILIWAVTLAVLGAGAQTPAPAGPPANPPRYDASTEATFNGSVEAVNQITGPRGWGGTHLTLKTEKESIDVHVGPSWFLTQKQVSFSNGNLISVIGSRVKFAGSDAVIARQIKKGDQTLTLRDAQGFPLWARSRRP